MPPNPRTEPSHMDVDAGIAGAGEGEGEDVGDTVWPVSDSIIVKFSTFS